MRIQSILESVSAGGMGTGSIATAPSAGKTMIHRQQKETIDLADQGEYDREGDMARDKLYTAAELRSILDSNENLPEWVQSKITKAMDYLDTARDYIKSQGVAEGKEDKIKQLKQDYATAVHWSKNETSPQKREAARQKAEKIKRHLDTQYKQGVAEGEGNVEIGQQMANDGITYSPDKEDELIGLMSQYMKKAGMSSKQIRYLLSYDEDYIPDQLSFLPKKGMAENKKGVRAVKHTVKPRNFVAKNAVQSGAGAHKDKKKAQKQGDVKHKGKEPAYESVLWEKLEKRIVK